MCRGDAVWGGVYGGNLEWMRVWRLSGVVMYQC